MRQKCVKNARNTFGGEHLLNDTDSTPTKLAENGMLSGHPGLRVFRIILLFVFRGKEDLDK